MSGNSISNYGGEFNGDADPHLRAAAYDQLQTHKVVVPNTQFAIITGNLKGDTSLLLPPEANAQDTAPTQSYQEAQEASVAHVDAPSTDPVTLAKQAVLEAYAKQPGQPPIVGL